jgi:rod shape determining protein RodA
MALGRGTVRPPTPVDRLRRGFGAIPWREIDHVLVGAMALLGVIGVFTVYSATRTRLEDLGIEPAYYAQRQLGYLVVFVAVFVAVDLGPFSVQPAEFTKHSVLVVVAAYAADSFSARMDYHRFTIALWLLALPVGLILLQPDLGSATVLVAGVAGVLLVAGARRRYFLTVVGVSVLTVGLSVVGRVVNDYQIGRFRAWLNQDSTDRELREIVLQVRYAKRAVASGGLFGKGYLEGPLTNGKFVPVQASDFPFSAISEQFGMVGGLVVIGLFAVVLWRLWVIASTARQPFDRLFVSGVFAMILWQVFQNLGMTMGLVPVSGVPLPFVSYGGSHLTATALLTAMSVSVHMRRKG